MYNWSHRKNQRLKNFDYSQNWYYFVTICTKNREDFFWEIINWKMILNDYWKIAENEILITEKIRKEIKIDEFVIMPNHLHICILITNIEIDAGIVRTAGPLSLHTGDIKKNKLSNTIQRIKSAITLQIRKKFNDLNFAWQRSFFDVVIKNEDQLNKTRQYILDNPLKWELDVNNSINFNKNIKKLCTKSKNKRY